MGVTLMEFGNYMRKGVMFSIRGCLHHPFLVFIVSGMIYISRAFPFMFSLLLPASPVVVCAAVLLGTLLYYGQQGIHETEIEMKSKHEGVSLRNHKFIDANNASVVAEKKDRHFVEKCGESVERKLGMDSNLVGRRLGEIRVGVDGLRKGICVGVDGSSKGRRSSEIESENGESGEESEGLGDHRVHEAEEREIDGEGGGVGDGDGEVMADHYAIISKVIGELLESESDHEKSEADSGDSEMGNRVDHHEDEEEGDRESLNSGSDEGESLSPDDASIEDIMPTMLDELHPLLDEDVPQPPQMSHASSEAVLNEQSPSSSIDSSESADETDVQESEAVDDVDDDDDDAEDDSEDHTKSVITWTEEDQKNLMEVGNSEIERNRRLERIIRRRRNRSMVPEINLTEFKKSDFEFQIAPISTARRNPFDLPQDSGPGSAPSVLSRRRTNPFDLPDELIEEDPKEMGDISRVELKKSLTRHPLLRRRENFSARPSIFSPNRLEGRPVKIRPFFVAEQVVADDSSYSPFKRQSSKVRFALEETESVGFKRQSSEHSSASEETESFGSVEYFEDEGEDDSEEFTEDDPSWNRDQISNDEESADTSTSWAEGDKGPNRGAVYETDTSPTAGARLEVEPDGDGMQVTDTLMPLLLQCFILILTLKQMLIFILHQSMHKH